MSIDVLLPLTALGVAAALVYGLWWPLVLGRCSLGAATALALGVGLCVLAAGVLAVHAWPTLGVRTDSLWPGALAGLAFGAVLGWHARRRRPRGWALLGALVLALPLAAVMGAVVWLWAACVSGNCL